MSYRFNPFTGNLDLDTQGAGGGGGGYNINRITLNGAQEIAKAVTLSGTPTTATSTVLIVRNAPGMFYGSDFTVSGTTLSWNGLGLDGILASGDEITVLFD